MGGTFNITIIEREKEFTLGERIEFDELEFGEIAFTILEFAQSVAKALEAAGTARVIDFSPAPGSESQVAGTVDDPPPP